MATRPRDLYAVLEVDRKASQDDIKKAYRRLAREYHPDANPGDASAEERFKEVSQAYDVLADAEKRRSYDRAGVGGFTGGVRTGGAGAGGGFDVGGIGDIISDLFGNAARRGGGGGASGTPPRKPRQERGLDVESEVSLSFAQAMEGGQVTISVPLTAACDTCRGSGAKPGTSPRSCPKCPGRGVEAEGQGLFSIFPAVFALRGARGGRRRPVPDLLGQRHQPHGQEIPREHPRGGQGGQPRAGGRQGGGGAQRRAVRRPLCDHAGVALTDLHPQG